MYYKKQRKAIMDRQTDMTDEYQKAKKMSIIAVILIIFAFSCLIVPALTQYYDEFNTVLLPHPLSPTIPICSPASAPRDRFLITLWPS